MLCGNLLKIAVLLVHMNEHKRTKQVIIKSLFMKWQVRFYLRYVSKNDLWCYQMVVEPANISNSSVKPK